MKTRNPRGTGRPVVGSRVRRSVARPMHYRRRLAQDDEYADEFLEDDEFSDLDLDAILDVDEDDVEPLSEEEFLQECPPGCMPIPEKDDEGDEDEPKDVVDEDDGDDEDDEDDEDDGDKKEASVNRTMWAAVLGSDDISKIGKNADVAMLYHDDGKDPHYVVVAEGKPVGEIRRSDLNLDPESAVLFSQERWAQDVVAAIDELGFNNVMPDLNLRYYAAKVTDRMASKKAKHLVLADRTQNLQTKLAELKTRFIKNLNLAIEASLKNVMVENPLRDAVRVRFKTAGVPDAVIVDLFEDAVQDAGAQYFAAMVEQADEWMGFEPDAMQQVEKMVKKSNYKSPAERGVAVDEIPQQRSVPAFRTMAVTQSQQQEDSFERSAAALRHGLVRSGSIFRGR